MLCCYHCGVVAFGRFRCEWPGLFYMEGYILLARILLRFGGNQWPSKYIPARYLYPIDAGEYVSVTITAGYSYILYTPVTVHTYLTIS